MDDKYNLIFIGRFQPFTRGHLDALLYAKFKYNLDKIIMFVVQDNDKKDNPIPLDFRIKHISTCLSNYFNNFYVFGIEYKSYYYVFMRIKDILEKNFNKNDKYLIITSDNSKYIIYLISSLLYRFYGYKIYVKKSDRTTRARDIRREIRNGNREMIKYIACYDKLSDEDINRLIYYIMKYRDK